jgi:hypothetical protein
MRVVSSSANITTGGASSAVSLVVRADYQAPTGLRLVELLQDGMHNDQGGDDALKTSLRFPALFQLTPTSPALASRAVLDSAPPSGPLPRSSLPFCIAAALERCGHLDNSSVGHYPDKNLVRWPIVSSATSDQVRDSEEQQSGVCELSCVFSRVLTAHLRLPAQLVLLSVPLMERASRLTARVVAAVDSAVADVCKKHVDVKEDGGREVWWSMMVGPDDAPDSGSGPFEFVVRPLTASDGPVFVGVFGRADVYILCE